MDTFAAFFALFGPFRRQTTTALRRLAPEEELRLYGNPSRPATPAAVADEPGLAWQQRRSLGLARSLLGSPLRG